MTYKLVALPYAYDALAPHFDKETMAIHHQRHHQAYVDNLNKAIVGTSAEQESLVETLGHISDYTPAVRNNAGGHYNHDLFWKILSPKAKLQPSGRLAQLIDSEFGSLDNLKEAIKQAALTQFGSGWAWLYVKPNGHLAVCSTPNQDNPLMDVNAEHRGTPILGIDVWEHAYYLHYQNKRADYLDAFWSVLDWAAVEENYKTVVGNLK